MDAAARLRRRLPAGARTWLRLLPRRRRSLDARPPRDPALIDPDRLKARLSDADLNHAADEYFRHNLAGSRDYYLRKPLANPTEAVDLLISFGHVLALLELQPGMTVLDFGCGTGWTSRFLAQLGVRTTLCDVSRHALDFAADDLRWLGEHVDIQPSSFLCFDGETIDAAAASFDRVLCFDALHHVPNRDRVIAEIGRVLEPGGIAVFNEPGPNHSATAASQDEMRNFTVLEDDILVREIEATARRAGLVDLRLAVYSSECVALPIDGYERLLARRREAFEFLGHHFGFLEGRRTFALTRR